MQEPTILGSLFTVEILARPSTATRVILTTMGSKQVRGTHCCAAAANTTRPMVFLKKRLETVKIKHIHHTGFTCTHLYLACIYTYVCRQLGDGVSDGSFSAL